MDKTRFTEELAKNYGFKEEYIVYKSDCCDGYYCKPLKNNLAIFCYFNDGVSENCVIMDYQKGWGHSRNCEEENDVYAVIPPYLENIQMIYKSIMGEEMTLINK